MDEDMLKRLALLKALQDAENHDTPKTQDSESICVSSIRDANILLQMHMDEKSAAYRKRLVSYVTDPANQVRSECNVYHNFIMDLSRCGDFLLALQVCDYALSFAPYNRDMLADAINACAESSQFEKGEKYLGRALEIPKELWSFRLFLYSVSFLKNKLSAYPMDAQLYQRAFDLSKEYQKFYPFDEHGYNQEAELLLMMNKRSDAILILTKYIKDFSPDSKDSKSRLVTAQCCVTLLNTLDDSSDYQAIIDIAEIGLRNTTQEQPSALICFFVYRKALAMDALCHAEDFKDQEYLVKTLKTYQAAYDLDQKRQFSSTIEQRYAVLRPYAKNFKPLVKRHLYVLEKENAEETTSIDQIL